MSPRTRRCLDLLFVGLLMVVPSVSLVPVYGTWAPVAVWAIGVGTAVLAGLLCQSTGLPAWVGVPVGLLLAVAVGPSAVAGAPTLPAGEPLRNLLQGAVSGWREVVTVATPIGTTGALLVPALVTGLVVGTVAAVAVVGQRPAWALLGLPVGAAVAGALGPAGLPWWAVLALLVAAVLGLVWVVVRRAEGAALVTGAPSLRWRRPLTAAIVLLLATAAGAGTVVAAGTDDRFAVRTSVAVPVTPIVVPSPLTDYRHLTVDLADETLLQVNGLEQGDRIRVAALDAYDGLQFTVGTAGGAFARLGTEREVTTAGSRREVTVTVAGWSGEYVPTVGELQSISFTGDRSAALTDAFRYSAVAFTGVLPHGLRTGDTWDQSAVVAAVPAAETVAQDRLALGDFPATVTVPEVIRAAAAEYTDGSSTPRDQLVALQQVLSTRGYFSQGRPDQLRSPAGHGLNRLIDMVSSTTMIGDDEQYAALMVVLARSLGIPARVVVGFESPATTSGEIALTGADLAVWVEADFVGAGWVAYDPTPPRDRTELDTEPPTRAGRHVADNQPPPAAAAGDQAQVQADSAGRQQDDPQDDPQNDRTSTGLPWWVWTALGLVGLLVVAASPFLLVLVWKALRRSRRRRTVDPAGRTRAAWREMVDVARDTGFRPVATGTRTEISADLLTATGVDTLRLAGAADQAEFGPPGTAQEAERSWAAATGASTALRQRLPAVARRRSRFSPASLRSLPGLDRVDS